MTTTQIIVSTIAVAAAVGAALCARIATRALASQQLRIDVLEEDIMAQFDSLNGHISELKATVAETADRVEAALAVKADDTADQAAVDQADADIAAAIASMRAIAQAPTPEPEPEPAPEPAPAPEDTSGGF